MANDPASPERDLDGDLAEPADRATQLEIREIGTGDQEHETNSAPYRAIKRGSICTNKFLLEIRSAGTDILIGQGVSGFQPASDGIHFCPGAPDGDAIRHAAEGEP